MTGEVTGPLVGLRVVELGRYIAGPYTAQLLADMGADVIKVETPGGDPFRYTGRGVPDSPANADAPTTGYGVGFVGYNRGKRSVTVDLRSDGGVDTLRRLLGTADVFVENFRPGVLAGLGLGAEDLIAVNPRLIYCSITGYGGDGSWNTLPSYDSIGQARSGMLSQIADPDNPRVVGPPLSDGVTGLNAANAILGAVFARERTGRGQRVEIAMIAATAAFLAAEAVDHFATGKPQTPLDRPARSQAFAFRCGDGAVLVVHLSTTEKFFPRLVGSLGRADLTSDPRFANYRDRVTHYGELGEELRAAFLTRSRTEWLERLDAADVPAAPVLSLQEVFDDPLADQLGLESRIEHPICGPVRTVAPPAHFSRTPVTGLAAPPLLGEDNAVLGADGAAQNIEGAWRPVPPVHAVVGAR